MKQKSSGCRIAEVAEADNEVKLFARYAGRPLAMLGVNGDRDPATGLKAAEAKKMTWPSIWDGAALERGALNGEIAARYSVTGIPQVYIIDADGIIRSTLYRSSDVEPLIEELVRKAEAAMTRPPGE